MGQVMQALVSQQGKQAQRQSLLVVLTKQTQM